MDRRGQVQSGYHVALVALHLARSFRIRASLSCNILHTDLLFVFVCLLGRSVDFQVIYFILLILGDLRRNFFGFGLQTADGSRFCQFFRCHSREAVPCCTASVLTMTFDLALSLRWLQRGLGLKSLWVRRLSLRGA